MSEPRKPMSYQAAANNVVALADLIDEALANVAPAWAILKNGLIDPAITCQLTIAACILIHDDTTEDAGKDSAIRHTLGI